MNFSLFFYNGKNNFSQGKTAVWIPYSETGYTKGYKMGEEEDPKTKKMKIKVSQRH